MVTAPRVQCEDICNWALSQIAISMNFYSCRVLRHDEIEYINGCEILECHGLVVLGYAYLKEVVFKNNPSDHET